MNITLPPTFASSSAVRAVPKPSPRFSGFKDYEQAVREGNPPEDAFAALVRDLPEGEARKLLGKFDLPAFIRALGNSVKSEPAERVNFLNQVNQAAEETRQTASLGEFNIDDIGNVTIVSYDNPERTASITNFNAMDRNGKVFGPDTPVETFIKQAFGDEPKVIISPVGWTVPDPTSLMEFNETFRQAVEGSEKPKAEAAARKVADPKADPQAYTQAFEKEYTRLKKAAAAKAYEKAFNKFWGPVANYLFEVAKLPKNRFAFITSASDAGIDKAAMDFADTKGIAVANVTPFCYAKWMGKRNHPLLVVNSNQDYAKACAEIGSVLWVTGGAGHTWNHDVFNFLIDKNKPVIATDIMKRTYGYNIPPMKNGQVINAAAQMEQRGFTQDATALAENISDSTGLTREQKLVAAQLITLHNQITVLDDN